MVGEGSHPHYCSSLKLTPCISVYFHFQFTLCVSAQPKCFEMAKYRPNVMIQQQMPKLKHVGINAVIVNHNHNHLVNQNSVIILFRKKLLLLFPATFGRCNKNNVQCTNIIMNTINLTFLYGIICALNIFFHSFGTKQMIIVFVFLIPVQSEEFSDSIDYLFCP